MLTSGLIFWQALLLCRSPHLVACVKSELWFGPFHFVGERCFSNHLLELPVKILCTVSWSMLWHLDPGWPGVPHLLDALRVNLSWVQGIFPRIIYAEWASPVKTAAAMVESQFLKGLRYVRDRALVFRIWTKFNHTAISMSFFIAYEPRRNDAFRVRCYHCLYSTVVIVVA